MKTLAKRATRALILGISFSLVLSAHSSRAALFSLPELDTTMTEPIFKTLAAGLTFRSVEPASDLGKLGGFYLGVSGSAFNASQVSSIFTSGGGTSYLPMADIQFGIGVPFGFTLEAGILPSLSFSGTKFGRYGGALKWSMTRTLLMMLPFDLAARIGYTSANLSYSQQLQGVNLDVGYKSGIFTQSLMFSKSLTFFEPFLGLGLAEQSSTLDSTGSASLFGTSFPAGTQSFSAANTSLLFQAGFLIKASIFGLAFEYDSLFGVPSYTGKVSFRL